MGTLGFRLIAGAGFLGSHLCERLLAEGNDVCADNFFTGTKDAIQGQPSVMNKRANP